MCCQSAEILKVYQILMYKILCVGTHLIHFVVFFKLVNFHLQTTLHLFVLLLLSLPGTPSGLWHSEFIARLLQGLYKNTNKIEYKNADKLRSFLEDPCCRRLANFGGCKQAFQGPPRTSQHITARQSSMAKKSFRGPRSATRGRVGLVC
jgi:hypothetical protein